MKKIIKPFIQEEAVYYSDFKGTMFNSEPDVELHMVFNHGSKYDGSHLNLHLTDSEAETLLSFIKSKMTPEALNNMKHNPYEQLEFEYGAVLKNYTDNQTPLHDFFMNKKSSD